MKVFRIMRVLRPLRLIARNEGLKLAINSLVFSIPFMLNLLLVCFIFFLMFGIFGVNFFKGTFYKCVDIELEGVTTMWDCMDRGGNWVNEKLNFDNILQAMISLYVIASTEGWIDMMWLGVDSRGIKMQPHKDNQLYWSIFYIGFIVVGSFFIMNLFAGVVVDSFNQEREKIGGVSSLTH